ncbi:hypothetical protein CAURIC_09585 [Corynebacterium auriscanis]|uniref:hypothetical protein n=1 Tax=Corynebacterium auriscanis TaxID=99807 RepID=UPI000B02CBD4|nr:hypothetical protein [Corynebacterium auriscanis]WJY73520.1 hypothetical protein CAURIC_09585 [Corynebacterium auriscanis]
MDALALTTTTLSGVTAATTLAAGGWARWRARQSGETSRAHFYLIAPAQHLWQPTSGWSLDVARLCEGAGLSLHDAHFFHHPTSTGVSPYPGRGSMARCVVSIPSTARDGFKHAAAGCGVIAVETPEARTNRGPAQLGHNPVVPPARAHRASSQSDHTASAPTDVTVPVESGWLLGLNGYGRAVEIFPVPGSTVLVLGPAPLVQIALRKLPWLPGLFTVISAENPASALQTARPHNASSADSSTQNVETLWRRAWDPHQTRIVVADHAAIAPTLCSAADAIIDLTTDVGRCTIRSPWPTTEERRPDHTDAQRSNAILHFTLSA